MKRILKALGKTLGFLSIGAAVGSTPIVLDHLFGPTASIIIVIGSLIVILFCLIYRNEK